MDKDKLKQMEELDARIEKTNFDLVGLETRKKEMEQNKFEKQQQIDNLEKEKSKILSKTDTMNRFQRAIYIIFSSRTDLKAVDLINTKITENIKIRDNIQNKIDIQNKLYADTIKEKDSYIEQRKELYVSKINEKEKTNISEIQALTQIYNITKQFKDNKVMANLSQMVEKQLGEFLNKDKGKEAVNIAKSEEEQME